MFTSNSTLCIGVQIVIQIAVTTNPVAIMEQTQRLHAQIMQIANTNFLGVLVHQCQ